MIGNGDSGFDWTPAWLQTLRGRPNRRRAVLVAVGLVGLGLAWFHWIGLILGGALIGLVSRTTLRAIAAAFAFGLAMIALSVITVPAMEIHELLGLTPISYVTVASALIAPMWGALVRLVV